MTEQTLRAPIRVIAERRYKIRNKGAMLSEILVQIGEPHQTRLYEWRCRYRILGIRDDEWREAVSTDSLGALGSAIDSAAFDIRLLDDYKRGRLFWLVEGEKRIGLPMRWSDEEDNRSARPRPKIGRK
jgi:uncharacterized protein DUF6968